MTRTLTHAERARVVAEAIAFRLTARRRDLHRPGAFVLLGALVPVSWSRRAWRSPDGRERTSIAWRSAEGLPEGFPVAMPDPRLFDLLVPDDQWDDPESADFGRAWAGISALVRKAVNRLRTGKRSLPSLHRLAKDHGIDDHRVAQEILRDVEETADPHGLAELLTAEHPDAIGAHRNAPSWRPLADPWAREGMTAQDLADYLTATRDRRPKPEKARRLGKAIHAAEARQGALGAWWTIRGPSDDAEAVDDETSQNSLGGRFVDESENAAPEGTDSPMVASEDPQPETAVEAATPGRPLTRGRAPGFLIAPQAQPSEPEPDDRAARLIAYALAMARQDRAFELVPFTLTCPAGTSRAEWASALWALRQDLGGDLVLLVEERAGCLHAHGFALGSSVEARISAAWPWEVHRSRLTGARAALRACRQPARREPRPTRAATNLRALARRATVNLSRWFGYCEKGSLPMAA